MFIESKIDIKKKKRKQGKIMTFWFYCPSPHSDPQLE